jgi:multisubunit Na+/H+ antiporter MnhF subunit
MNHYQTLGIITMVTLGLALAMTIYILMGKHSLKRVYALAGFTMGLMVILTVLCTIIYRAYHIG